MLSDSHFRRAALLAAFRASRSRRSISSWVSRTCARKSSDSFGTLMDIEKPPLPGLYHGGGTGAREPESRRVRGGETDGGYDFRNSG